MSGSGRIPLIRLVPIFPVVWVLLLSGLVPLIATDSVFRVREVILRGNDALSTRELLAGITSREGEIYHPEAAVNDSKLISSMYMARGLYRVVVMYPEVEILNPREVKLTFRINEREENAADSVHFSGTKYLSDFRLRELLGVSRGKVTPLGEIPRLLRDIGDLYAERGFLFIESRFDSLVTIGDHRVAFIGITEGPLCRVGHYTFEGNSVTTPATLLKISNLADIDILTLPLIEATEEVLRRKAYIAEAEIRPLGKDEILVRIEEDKMTTASALFGYDNNRNEKRLTGYVHLDFLNLFGTDRSISIDWERLSAYKSSIGFEYHESGPWDIPVAADIALYRQEADSTYIHSAVDSKIYYYNLYHKLGLYVGLDDYTPGLRKDNTIDRNLLRKFGSFWNYNSEDFSGNPTSGDRLDILVYYIFQTIGETGDQRLATEIDWVHYFPLGRRFVLATGVHGRQTEKSRLQDYELYTLGGFNSLRGFPEEAYSGWRVGWANTELRWLVSRRSRVYILADWGYATLAGDTDVVIDDLLGFGLGFQAQVAIGILRIEYAFGYGEGEWRNPMDGIIHFGIESKL